MEDLKAKAEAVRGAEVEERQAMAVCPTDILITRRPWWHKLPTNPGCERTVGVTGRGHGKVYISARSKGDVNVHLAMERMGGGGNMNTAGAQIENSSIEDTTKKLNLTIRKMIEEGIL